MGKTIVNLSPTKGAAQRIANNLNASFKKSKVKRVAKVCKVSNSFAKKITGKGAVVRRTNYGVCVKNKR